MLRDVRVTLQTLRDAVKEQTTPIYAEVTEATIEADLAAAVNPRHGKRR